MSRITAPVGEVTTPITSGRKGRGRFLSAGEQPLGGEPAAALLEQRHQRADARGLHAVDDQLIARAARDRW